MAVSVARQMEMGAEELRRAGLLWPQALDEIELRHEHDHASRQADKHPISLPMLAAEMRRRGLL